MDEASAKKGEKVSRRKTVQRELVFQAVCYGNHLSAREIFDSVAKTDSMSFGTVYRNLQILTEEGRIAEIQTDPFVTRYDPCLTPHHHLYCKKCGKVFDVPVPYRTQYDEEAQKNSGVTIDSHTISFQGVCSECRNKQQFEKIA
jgi:Fur family peroxide stress response transcriptional regulator